MSLQRFVKEFNYIIVFMTKTNSDGIFNVPKIRNFNIVEVLLVTRDGDDRCQFMIRLFFLIIIIFKLYMSIKREF